MSKIIKSIQVKEDCPIKAYFKDLYFGNIKEVDINFCLKYPEFFEIEYEPEAPKLLKRPDGSLISEPEEGTKCLFIELDNYHIINFTSGNYNESKNSLAQGLVYLKEDEILAEKKSIRLEKYFEIQFEIERLNAEDNEEKNHTLWYFRNSDSGKNIDCICLTGAEQFNAEQFNCGRSTISRKTAEIILEKYSQDELKQYLGIII